MVLQSKNQISGLANCAALCRTIQICDGFSIIIVVRRFTLMEITWYGHSCFRLTERNYATVVTDPFDSKSIGYDSLKLRSDIVTVSHDAPGHNNVNAVKGTSNVIDIAGEFEIG